VEANYYGRGGQTLTGPVTLQAELFTDYGRENEKRRAVTLRLGEKKETVKVGEIER